MNSVELIKKIEEKSYKVGIVGLGYVGLPLMWTFHQNDIEVKGFDIDERKIECLDKGEPYIKHLGEEMMGVLAKSDKCSATTDFTELSSVDAVIMCVPTPLDEHREPDMSYVIDTTEVIGENLRKGQLVILESTTYPGTTEELIIPILEDKSGLRAGEDFYVAYSPEREDPGNPDFNTAKIPKVVGGHGEDALKVALALYNTSIVETVPVSDTKTAEAVKITENVFRSVNIALVNELKIVFQKMGIDVHEVLDAAATKPFGFMKFSPGPGLGGHCIPIDPFYLTWKAREFGENTRFIELAGEINTAMPSYVVNQTMLALNENGKAVKGSKILLVGLAYKPNVDDMRESPTFELMDIFKSLGADVDYFDSYIPVILPTREHKDWTGKKSISWDLDLIKGYDAVVISTNHSNIDYDQLLESSNLIIDTRNSFPVNQTGRNSKIKRA